MKTTFRNFLFFLGLTFPFQASHQDPTPLAPVVQVHEVDFVGTKVPFLKWKWIFRSAMLVDTKIKIFFLSLVACEAVAFGIWLAFGENYAVHLAVVAVVITLVAKGKKEAM